MGSSEQLAAPSGLQGRTRTHSLGGPSAGASVPTESSAPSQDPARPGQGAERDLLGEVQHRTAKKRAESTQGPCGSPDEEIKANGARRYWPSQERLFLKVRGGVPADVTGYLGAHTLGS